MKTSHRFLVILTAMAFSFVPALVRAQDVPPPPPPPADDQADQSDQGASFQTFYDQLGDQGNWVQTDDYGYVFQPNVTDPGWAPYTDGHWVYTDAGWAWVSDEPWGWATYHYGRWINIDGTGWVWVPGYQWAPAWVSWRYGGGYCGWAPLPPETIVGVGIGFHFGGDVDVNFNIGPGFYNFVRVGDMGERNYRGHFMDRSRNFAIINNTTNVTNININGTGGAQNFRGVAVGGPSLRDVNAGSHQHIPTVQLAAANQPGQGHLQGNSLAVYAPRFNPATAQQARPARVAQTISHPTFNRGDSITKPLAVTASVKPPPPSAAAIEAAKTAQLHASPTAKIATEKTTVTPLTSLKPVTPFPTTANGATGGGSGSANTFKPKTEEHTANTPATGGSVKPAVTQTQSNEIKPTPVYHPQAESSGSGNQVYHASPTPHPTEAFHPQTQSSGSQVYHSTVTPPPAETYHPQTQSSGGQTYHPQQQNQPQQQSHQSQPSNKQGGSTNNATGGR